MGEPPHRAAPAPGAPDDLLGDNLNSLLGTCDVVFGTTCVGLALVSIWLFVLGEAKFGITIALVTMVGFNLFWSVFGRRFTQPTGDLLRNAISLPLATFAYVADLGAMSRMSLPAVMMVIYTSLSLGLASPRPVLPYLVTLVYGAAIVVAAVLRFGALDFVTVNHVIALGLVGIVLTMVASRLRRSLDDAQRRRDEARTEKVRAEATARELEQTLTSLHHEIAQRARAEVELRQAQKLESIGRLAAGVAHEINTPVQYVNDNVHFVREAIGDLFALVDKLGVVQRATASGERSPEAEAEAAEAAVTADLPYLTVNVPRALASAIDGLHRVATIVRSLKEFAHPSSGDRIAVDLNRAIRSTLTVARNEYKYVATVETELGELPLVWCRIGELNQAVLNIVVNAAHAIGDVVAGTTDRGRITVRTYREDDHAVIAISDTGTGISQEVADRIFEPFFTTKEVGRGTGQGLAIARSVVVDKHGGQLWLETALGKGTTFFIRLPIHEGKLGVAGRVLDPATTPASQGAAETN